MDIKCNDGLFILPLKFRLKVGGNLIMMNQMYLFNCQCDQGRFLGLGYGYVAYKPQTTLVYPQHTQTSPPLPPSSLSQFVYRHLFQTHTPIN